MEYNHYLYSISTSHQIEPASDDKKTAILTCLSDGASRHDGLPLFLFRNNADSLMDVCLIAFLMEHFLVS